MKKKINGVIYLRMEVVCYVHIYNKGNVCRKSQNDKYFETGREGGRE
jgi:hypothetical protein